MKKLLILLILVISLKVTGATYYVATTGNDSYTKVQAQNPATPWLTIQKGADEAVAGDTVIVKDGTYTLTEQYIGIIYTSGTDGNPIVFKSETLHGAILDGNEMENSGAFALIDVSYITIDGFEMKDFIRAGVVENNADESEPYPSNIIIKNCHIHHIGKICTDDAYGMDGIFMRSVNDITINNNIFNDIGRYAPGESGCSGLTTSYYKNHDHPFYGIDIDGLDIYNNIFYNNDNGWSVQITDPPFNDVKIYNNTFDYGNHWDISGSYGSHVILGTASNVEIKNNIFNDCEDNAIYLYDYPTYSNVIIDHNIAYGGEGNIAFIVGGLPVAGVTISDNLEDTDPLFVDRGSYDFKLQSESPAKYAGTDVGLSTDYDGVSYNDPPSMGAFEYVAQDPAIRTSIIKHDNKVIKHNGKIMVID